MTGFLADLQIRNKLTILFTGAAAVAVALLCVGVISYDSATFRQDLTTQQRNLLKIMGSNVSAAVVFNDESVIRENLALYEYQPDVIAARALGADRQQLAVYMNTSFSGAGWSMPVSGSWETLTLEDGFVLQEEVRFDGEVIGYVQAIVSLDALNERVWLYIRLGFLTVFATLLVAFVIARRFARQFSEPLEDLVDTAKKVSRSGDYSVRVQPSSNDEIGHMTRYFNDMLEEIERRDKGLLRQKYSLEQLVERKTQEIRAALEKSEAASQAKSEFLANMSHELRTPLNAVLGFSEVMVQEVFGKHSNTKYRDYAGLIHESGAHLLDIINDLLDLAKVEAGKTELVIEATDMVQVMNEVTEMMAVWAQRKHQDLHFELRDELPPVFCDRRMIKQVLVNLLSNAVKFTPDSGRISVALEKPSPEFVQIIVADNGRGMTAEEIKLAMQPFGQAQSIFSRSHEGTGLGLPLVEQFLSLHKAKMHIQSTPGEGTEIRVMLPVGTPVEPSDSP